MKKGKSIKNILVCTLYLILMIVCIFGIYILISKTSNKENDNIVQAQDSSTYFRNVNPKFLIDFVNNEYVRFETVSSYINPFKNEKQSIWEKIKYALGLKQERKGVQISLIEVSYDTDLAQRMEDKNLDIPAYSLSKSFELTTSGREIGNDSDKAVSKDTVISQEIYPGVDLEYQVIKGKGLKEEIILNEMPEYTTECDSGKCSMPVNRFLFKLQLDEGLTIKRSIDGNEQFPTGTYYVTDDSGDYFAHFLPEFAVDSVGYKTSNVVSNISLTDSGEYIYEIILDPEWLLSSERVFPIRIDPSIVHDSEMIFNQGIYDRLQLDQALTISLKSNEYISGTYTSSVLDLGENNKLNNISWNGFAQATGNGEIPFSTLGLTYENNFNDLVSDRKKWGGSALKLGNEETKLINIESNTSDYITLEFWSYKRNLSNEQNIFSSNLGSLKLKDGRYIFEDTLGTVYESNIPVKYNSWQYIALVFNITNSRLLLYIDESEVPLNVGYSDQIKLNDLTLKGFGYIDSLRIYERLLAKNELLSNSQYSNIYLQYMTSFDNVSWGEWFTKSKYIPTPVISEKYIDIQSNEESIGNFDILSFEFLSDTSRELTLGTTKFSDGVDEEDIKRLDQTQGALEGIQQIKYIDLLITPTTVQSSCILSLGGLEISTLDTGMIQISLGGETLLTEDMYVPKVLNHIGISLLDTESRVYMNGNVSKNSTGYTLSPTQYTVGSGCSGSTNTFDGKISDVRISTNQKDESEILKYSKISDRTYMLKPMFKAHLQNDSQILDLNSTTFNISEMLFGAPNHISNLSLGDTIVIKEGDYSVEGKVISLESDTGLVNIEKWNDGGTVPELGFSTAAVILKWQTEYISTKAFLDIDGQVNYVNMKYDDTQNIKNISLFSGLNADDSMSFTATNDRYVKYRLIYMTSKYGISPYISGVNIEYDNSGPGMEQIMRHGKWFNEGNEQTFWWSK